MGFRFARRRHTLQLRVEARSLEKQRKRGVSWVVKPAGGTFEIECDEGPYLDGDGSAPPPLSYFTSSIAF